MNLYIENPPTHGGSWVAVSDDFLVPPVMNILSMLNPKGEYIIELELIGQCTVHTDDIESLTSVASSLGLTVVEITLEKDTSFCDTIIALNLPLYNGSSV